MKLLKRNILDYPLTWMIAGSLLLGLSIDVKMSFFKGIYLVGGVWLLIEANNVWRK